jgi:hypothetical protein
VTDIDHIRIVRISCRFDEPEEIDTVLGLHLEDGPILFGPVERVGLELDHGARVARVVNRRPLGPDE